MDLHELSPFPVYIQWEGKEIKLRPFDLRAITWAERFFCEEGKSGFERMNQILGDSSDIDLFTNTVVEIVFYLSEGFESVGIHTARQLKEEIKKSEDRQLIFIGLKEALENVLLDSFPEKEEEPEVMGGAIYQMLKAREEKEKRKSVKWEQIYAEFFRAGGMSIEQFYSLTMKQIDGIYSELKIQHGEDLSKISRVVNERIVYKEPKREEKVKFTKEEVALFEKQHAELMKGNRIH